MPFDKPYPNRKDWRKPYQSSRRKCARQYGCNICMKGRQHQTAKANVTRREQVKEWQFRAEIELDSLYEGCPWNCSCGYDQDAVDAYFTRQDHERLDDGPEHP